MVTIAFFAVLGLMACHHDDAASSPDPRSAPAVVSADGREIRFGEESAQLREIAVDTVRRGLMHLGVTAPARVAVSVVAPAEAGAPLVLFENQDVTQLFSDYTKSRSAAERSATQLARVRDLCAHKIAPEKDLVDASSEHAQAVAELAERESRLRAAGIDARALQAARPGSVWIVAEVAESNVAPVHAGARATVTCTSFPGEQFTGSVAAIGDVIDPATRTVKVRIAIANPQGKLRPGMFASATFSDTAADVITVNRDAIVHVQGKTYAFRRTAAAVFERVEVLLGAETPDACCVTAGLDASDIVATRGSVLLKGLSFGF